MCSGNVKSVIIVEWKPFKCGKLPLTLRLTSFLLIFKKTPIRHITPLKIIVYSDKLSMFFFENDDFFSEFNLSSIFFLFRETSLRSVVFLHFHCKFRLCYEISAVFSFIFRSFIYHLEYRRNCQMNRNSSIFCCLLYRNIVMTKWYGNHECDYSGQKYFVFIFQSETAAFA